jgi:hypothetical protein
MKVLLEAVLDPHRANYVNVTSMGEIH